jgi:hypothetical protein
MAHRFRFRGPRHWPRVAGFFPLCRHPIPTMLKLDITGKRSHWVDYELAQIGICRLPGAKEQQIEFSFTNLILVQGSQLPNMVALPIEVTTLVGDANAVAEQR